MDKQHFDQLVKGVCEMKRHMAGKRVRGAKTTELPAPDVRTIREAAQIAAQTGQSNCTCLSKKRTSGTTRNSAAFIATSMHITRSSTRSGKSKSHSSR